MRATARMASAVSSTQPACSRLIWVARPINYHAVTEIKPTECLQPALSDYIHCRDELAKDRASQFWRRAFVKSSIVVVEAVIEMMRYEFLLHVTKSVTADKVLRYAALHAEDTRLTSTGVVEHFQRRTPFIPFVASVIRAYGDECGYDVDSFFSDHRWSSLRSAVRTRDRITHPKHFDALTVSDDELADVEAGHLHFWNLAITSICSFYQ